MKPSRSLCEGCPCDQTWGCAVKPKSPGVAQNAVGGVALWHRAVPPGGSASKRCSGPATGCLSAFNHPESDRGHYLGGRGPPCHRRQAHVAPTARARCLCALQAAHPSPDFSAAPFEFPNAAVSAGVLGL